MKPLRELGLAIVKASVDCLNGIKLLIEVPAGIERQKAEIFAFYEFLHFFLHITMRNASAVMSEHEIKHLWLGWGRLAAADSVHFACAIQVSEGKPPRDIVSSSLKSPTSDTARQESHQPASPASRLRGRLPSDRYRTTRSPLAHDLLPGGARPRGHPRAAAWFFPYTAFVLSADRSSRRARSSGNRTIAASPEPSGHQLIAAGVKLAGISLPAMIVIALPLPGSDDPPE